MVGVSGGEKEREEERERGGGNGERGDVSSEARQAGKVRQQLKLATASTTIAVQVCLFAQQDATTITTRHSSNTNAHRIVQCINRKQQQRHHHKNCQRKKFKVAAAKSKKQTANRKPQTASHSSTHQPSVLQQNIRQISPTHNGIPHNTPHSTRDDDQGIPLNIIDGMR